METLEREEEEMREREKMENDTKQLPPAGQVCIAMGHFSTFIEVRKQGYKIFPCPFLIVAGNTS